MNALRRRRWSPWAAGVALGLLSWFAFATVDRGLGTTAAFESTAALVEQAVAPGRASASGYLEHHRPRIDWEWTLVLGVVAGSWASARLSGEHDRGTVPPDWRARFGGSTTKRLVFAFLGGAILMLGARLAQGCTGAHGITGTAQLAVSSWVFIVLAAGAAVATAVTLFGGKPEVDRRVRRV